MTSTHVNTDATPVTSGIEPTRLIRGASRGFSVLAVGGVVQPLVGLASPELGYVWLVLVAVAAFSLSAWGAGATPAPGVQGAASAVAAYALMIPLVVMGAGALPWDQVVFTTLTAVITGGVVGKARSRASAGQKGDGFTPSGG